MLKNLLSRSEFAKNVLTLMTGTALSQVIPFIMLPVLQRWFFDKADFGLLTVFVTATGFLVTTASLTYEYAIVTQKRLKDAANIILLCLVLISGISLIALLVVFLFNEQITEVLKEPGISNYLYLIPLSILGYGGFQIFAYWFNREKKYKTMASGRVLQTGSGEGVKLATGLAGSNAGGLIIGRVIGQIFGLFYMAGVFLKRHGKMLKLFSWKHAKKMAKEHKAFPMYSATSVVLVSLVPLIFINMFLGFYGREVVGVIGTATSYIGAGIGIISLAISQVYYQRISEIKEKAKLKKNYTGAVKRLFIFAAMLVGVVYVIPSKLVVVVLGDEWSQMLPVMQIIVVWSAVSFVSASLSFIYVLVKKQHVMFLFEAFHVALVFASIYWGHKHYGDIESTLWCYTIAQAAYYLITIVMAFVFINQYQEEE